MCYGGQHAMQEALGVRAGKEPFGEKDFYLEELRGRSVLVALAPRVVAERAPLDPLAITVAELIRNGTRVLVWWPAGRPGTERRLLGAIERQRRTRRTTGRRRDVSPVLPGRLGSRASWEGEGLRGQLWPRFRRGRLCVLSVTGQVAASYPAHATTLGIELRIPKVVLVEPDGGLVAGGSRLSFVDGHVLDTLLRQGQAEWTGLGDRRSLLVAVDRALEEGVESVNLCTPAGIGEELFTYTGSGTLFTVDDYCRVGRLALDEFGQAERLLERGQREGLLKFRTREEIAQVLATAYGATICDRHLAGVAALSTAPYAEQRAGEIVGLYTITRFKGEGLGERLVSALLTEAARRDLDYVFACTIDDRAAQFFERIGFVRLPHAAVPAAKWMGYDRRRRSRVVTYRRDLRAGVALEGST
ncbi:MAG: GNAT family N-acetyltransferase [Candidatus Binatia bacterium]